MTAVPRPVVEVEERAAGIVDGSGVVLGTHWAPDRALEVLGNGHARGALGGHGGTRWEDVEVARVRAPKG